MSIFDYSEAKLHTLPDAPTLRTANEKQLHKPIHQMEALNADKIVPRFGTDPVLMTMSVNCSPALATACCCTRTIGGNAI
jgi:hypothetical protein